MAAERNMLMAKLANSLQRLFTEKKIKCSQTVAEESEIIEEQEGINYSHCIELKGAFKVKKEFFDSEVEKKVYDVLCAFINSEYIIAPHVAFREIFKWDWKLDWNLTNKVTKMHFDFVIYDNDYMPIMFLEIWGKDHYCDPKVMERDEFKAELLKEHDLKLLIIDMSEEIKNNLLAEKVIRYIKSEIPSRQDYPVYCPRCHSVMRLKRNTKTGDYFYGCSAYLKQTEHCPTCNVSSIPPLYYGIPDVK